MRWIERRLIRVATEWNVEEAMAAKPSRKQRKQLSETCLSESTLSTWLEIGGVKQTSGYIIPQPKPGQRNKEPTRTWELEFGITREDTWIPI